MAGLGKKPIMRSSARVAYAVDALSKAALADIVLDRVYAEVGEDATDEQVVACLQGWVETIQRFRGEKRVVSLADRVANFDARRRREQ